MARIDASKEIPLSRGKIALVAGIAAVLILAALAAWKGRPLYRRMLGHRLLHAAEKAAAERHPAEARRFFLLALQHSPGDPDILRPFASFLDANYDGGVVQIRAALSRENPTDAQARLDYAESALQYGNRRLAVHVLFHDASPALIATARYHHLAGVIHFLSNEMPEADAESGEAVRLDPQNPIYQANRATIELSSPAPSVREAAVASLEGFLSGGPAKPEALQSLLRYACKTAEKPAKFEEWAAAFRAAAALANPSCTTYLDAIRRWHPERWPQELAAFAEVARKNRSLADLTIQWLSDGDSHAELLAFRASLPPEWQQDETNLVAAAKAFLRLGKIEELTTSLQNEAGWKAIPAVRLAWQEQLRRTARGKPGEPGDEALYWRKAMNAAERDAAQLFTLANLARFWNWLDEYAAALWAISDAALPGADSATRELFSFYMAKADARGLLRVAEREYSLTPQNPQVAGNFAFLSFLLGANRLEAGKVAAQLCADYPGNLNFMGTKAFGLWQAGKIAEALGVYREVDTRQLLDTQAGVCYGYVLAAAHDPAAARYLEGAEKWLALPEEKQILQKARDSISAAE